MNYSRRSFLRTSSLALTGAGIALPGISHALPANSCQPVDTFFPDAISADRLRTLASLAVDAAHQAGAAYSDVRVADGRTFRIYPPSSGDPASGEIFFLYTFGIRVLVNGIWGFSFGVDPSPDSIAQAARSAVQTGRAATPRRASEIDMSSELAAIPVVKGEWSTPVAIDPFSISPDEHAKLIGAYMSIGNGISRGYVTSANFRWDVETRVFASSEGSLITQQLKRALPNIAVGAKWPLRQHGVEISVPNVLPKSAGFEIGTGTELQERIKTTIEEAVQLASYPEARADVGRFEAVLNGNAMGAILGGTLAPALEADRVLGEDADGDGTSFLAPTPDVLDTQLFSPKFNVTADRSLPSYGAARWDDEGVSVESFPVIQAGRIQNYFATRASLTSVKNLDSRTREMFRLRGASVTWNAIESPRGCASQLTMVPSAAPVSLDSMVSQISNGVLVMGRPNSVGRVARDQQLSGGAFMPGVLFEVKGGQLTRRLRRGAVQFSTKRLLRSIKGVGGSSTIRPWIESRGLYQTFPVIAPAALVDQLEIVQSGDDF